MGQVSATKFTGTQKAEKLINDSNYLRYDITDEDNLLQVEIHQEYETTDDGDEIIQDPAPWWLEVATADKTNAEVFKGETFTSEYIFHGGPYKTKGDAMKTAHEQIMLLVK